MDRDLFLIGFHSGPGPQYRSRTMFRDKAQSTIIIPNFAPATSARNDAGHGSHQRGKVDSAIRRRHYGGGHIQESSYTVFVGFGNSQSCANHSLPTRRLAAFQLSPGSLSASCVREQRLHDSAPAIRKTPTTGAGTPVSRPLCRRLYIPVCCGAENKTIQN